MLSPFLQQSHMRLRNDDGGEVSATWLAALDTQWLDPVDAGTKFRMRIAITEQNGEVARKSSFAILERINGGAWISVAADMPMIPYDSPNFAPGTNLTTQQITAGTFAQGFIVETGSVNPDIEIAGNGNTEIELCLVMDPAKFGSVYTTDDVIEIGLAYADLTFLDEYSVLPTFTVGVGAAGMSDLYYGSNNITDFQYNGPTNSMYYGSKEVYRRG